MSKSIISLAYRSQKEDDGLLYEDIKSENEEEYTEILEQFLKEVHQKEIHAAKLKKLLYDLEMAVGGVLAEYEERGYTVGFSDGISINNEIKALN